MNRSGTRAPSSWPATTPARCARSTNCWHRPASVVQPQRELGIDEADETGPELCRERHPQGPARGARQRPGRPSPTTPGWRSTPSTARPASTRRATPARAPTIAGQLRQAAGGPGRRTGGQRGARFQCVMVYMRHAERPNAADLPGHLGGAHPGPRPAATTASATIRCSTCRNRDCSAAELDAATKNALSHRGQALSQLVRR
jgi:XTP/dITP diphosphohydrolase